MLQNRVTGALVDMNVVDGMVVWCISTKMWYTFCHFDPQIVADVGKFHYTIEWM